VRVVEPEAAAVQRAFIGPAVVRHRQQRVIPAQLSRRLARQLSVVIQTERESERVEDGRAAAARTAAARAAHGRVRRGRELRNRRLLR